MKRALAAKLLTLAFLFSTPTLAKPALLQGSVAQYNEMKVASEIPWHTSLYDAEMQARREGKLVFWVHMLGDIKGAT
jgi:hypothetical protein